MYGGILLCHSYKQQWGGGSSSLAGLSDVNITSPESGDTIIYDGTTSKWINMQGGTATVNIALTINGTKNDVITIKDSQDTTITTCTFESGSTQGTIRINVPVGGQSYKFISSVAKDTTTGTSDYTKTIFISDANNQTVNVYPKNTLYWYGNEVTQLEARAIMHSSPSSTDYPQAPTITRNTNNMVITNETSGGFGYGAVTDAIYRNLSGITSLKCNCSATTPSGTWTFLGLYAIDCLYTPFTTYAYNRIVYSNTGPTTFEGIATLSIDSSNGGYLSIYICGGHGQQTTSITVNALWFEDDHEDYFTINGAKEDSITIKDSNNQTITTCNFDTGKTYGYVSKLLLPAGQSYKFVSSIAKDTIVGASNYTKTIYLEGNESELNIMPKRALYWYGNYIVEFTRESIQTNLSKTDLTNAMEIHWNTTQIGSGAYYTTNAINLSSYTKIKLNCTGISGTIRWFGEIASPNANSNYSDAVDNSNTGTGIKELDVSSLSTIDYIGIFLGGSTDNSAYITVSAFWLENEFENSIKINGAKEDIIAIRDADNQLVTTCVFSSGKTYGAVSKDLLPAGLYTFTSSVAKDTTNGTSDYSKVITLDGTESEVSVYPEKALYWYGNYINCRLCWKDGTSFNYNSIPNIVDGTNQITFNSGSTYNRGVVSNNKYSSGTLKALCSLVAGSASRLLIGSIPSNTLYDLSTISDIGAVPRDSSYDGILSGSITQTNEYLLFDAYTNSSNGVLKALWLE